MEPAPVPPHERAWRHPSELGPPPHEATTATGRVLIVTSAALGLIIVGVLAVAMTPDRAGTPTAAASTVSPARVEVVAMPRGGERAIVAPSSLVTRPSLALRSVVTPLGDGLAITTLDAIAAMGATLVARLPSGQAVEIVVVSTDESTGLAIVALPDSARTDAGYDMATEQPGPDDMVVVDGVETTVVQVVQLAALEVDEGTPVLDTDGDLVGLCSDAEDGTELVPLVGATTTTVSSVDGASGAAD